MELALNRNYTKELDLISQNHLQPTVPNLGSTLWAQASLQPTQSFMVVALLHVLISSQVTHVL